MGEAEGFTRGFLTWSGETLTPSWLGGQTDLARGKSAQISSAQPKFQRFAVDEPRDVPTWVCIFQVFSLSLSPDSSPWSPLPTIPRTSAALPWRPPAAPCQAGINMDSPHHPPWACPLCLLPPSGHHDSWWHILSP